MWKLNEIYAQNICAFRELKYTINQGVTTLIFGDNRDNESQRSNGSGKSALIECIALGITGSPLRRIKNEEIINDLAEEAFVELQFSNTSGNEKFIIERRLFRKGVAEVACYLFRGEEFAADEMIMPGIDAYNKFILETLGITKEELFNNFILSKYKYQNFLSCSDKDKKEIINNFSNGVLVDEAIERIQADIVPIEQSLKSKETELAGMDGRINALTEQIEKEKELQQERQKSREDKINEIKNSIADKRGLIRGKNADKAELLSSKEALELVDKALQELENSEVSLEDCFGSIYSKLQPYCNGNLTDWQSVFVKKKQELDTADEDLKRWENIFIKSRDEVERLTKLYESVSAEYKQFHSEEKEKHAVNEENTVRLKQQLHEITRRGENVKKERRVLSAAIETLRNKLAGLITCPSCGHEFLVSDKDFDSEQGRIEIESKQEQMDALSNELETADEEIEDIEKLQSIIRKDKQEQKAWHDKWSEKLGSIQREYQDVLHKRDQAERLKKHVEESIGQMQSGINGLHRKVFDEAFEIVDMNYKSIENKDKAVDEELKMIESSIGTLEDTMKELEEFTGENITVSLVQSLKECRDKSAKISQSKTLIEKELRRLEEQEQHFVHFKTYLANSKIEALSKITNEFLEDIGSDIRIRFSGYTVLKTGKVRDKISVSLIRAGLDCGSFGKFSAGEAARVNLATILSMQKLINANCDDDKGLDLLVLDEILEAVDEDGLASMFSSLNRIGTTTLVVSHGNIAESYPYITKIIKEHGESKIA